MARSFARMSMERFTLLAAEAGREAFLQTKRSGRPVTYRDRRGRLVKEYPGGRFEILELTAPATTGTGAGNAPRRRTSTPKG